MTEDVTAQITAVIKLLWTDFFVWLMCISSCFLALLADERFIVAEATNVLQPKWTVTI